MQLPIPLVVLTGFLGSGKTTLLKALLAKPELAGTAVIVNEFGDVGLDDALIASANDETVLLPSGCVCCAVRGDLIEALNRLYQQMTDGAIPELTRVVLETSGLADPAPIAHTLMTEHDLFRIYQLDGIITTADAELLPRQVDTFFETAKQIALADRIVLTKTDRASAGQIAASTAQIRALNPAAEIIAVINGSADIDLLVGLAAFEPVATKARALTWLAHERYRCAHTGSDDDRTHHDHDHDGHADAHADPQSHTHTHGVTAFALTFETPLDAQKLSFAMELLRMAHGDKLLRIKGIVNVAGEPLPFVIHGVQHVFYPPTTLESWPSDDRRSRLVFITQGLSENRVREVLQPLFATAAPSAEAFFTT